MQRNESTLELVRRSTRTLAKDVADAALRQAEQGEKTAVAGMATEALTAIQKVEKTSSRSAEHLNALQQQLAERGAELNDRVERNREWREEVKKSILATLSDKIDDMLAVKVERAVDNRLPQSLPTPPAEAPAKVFAQCAPACNAPDPARVEAVVPVLPHHGAPPTVELKMPSAPSPSGHISSHREPDAEVSLGHSIPRQRSRPTGAQRPVHNLAIDRSLPPILSFQQMRRPWNQCTQLLLCARVRTWNYSPLVRPGHAREHAEITRHLPVQESVSGDGDSVIRAHSPETLAVKRLPARNPRHQPRSSPRRRRRPPT